MAVRFTKNSVGIVIASLMSLWWVGSFFVIFYWWVWFKSPPDRMGILWIDAVVGVLGLAAYAALSDRLPN
jgi:hypothetical protein